MPNIENFRGTFQDLARPNRFRVSGFGAPDNLRFMARGATAPSSTLGVAEAPYQGRVIKLPGDRTYAEWAITVMYNTNNEDYEYFYRWHQGMNLEIANVAAAGGFGIVGKRDDGFVEMLDRSGQTINTWAIVGAFPTEIGQIDLDANTNDTIAEFTVTFAYDYHLVE